MSVTVSVPMPKIENVVALKDHTVRVTWKTSLRPRTIEDVDLSPLISAYKFYKPLREKKSLFRSVHVAEFGNVIAWGSDDAIDMAATSVERLAEESLTADDFRAFLNGNDLTQERAAIILGRSSRQIAYYTSGKRLIPRIVVLACYGYLARKQSAGGGLRGGSNVSTGPQPFTASGEITIAPQTTVVA